MLCTQGPSMVHRQRFLEVSMKRLFLVGALLLMWGTPATAFELGGEYFLLKNKNITAIEFGRRVSPNVDISTDFGLVFSHSDESAQGAAGNFQLYFFASSETGILGAVLGSRIEPPRHQRWPGSRRGPCATSTCSPRPPRGSRRAFGSMVIAMVFMMPQQ